jgi:general stress protein CsbA
MKTTIKESSRLDSKFNASLRSSQRKRSFIKRFNKTEISEISLSKALKKLSHRGKTVLKWTRATKARAIARSRNKDDDEDDAYSRSSSIALYPARLDIIPAFVGGLNPMNSFLAYFLGAVSAVQGTTFRTTAQFCFCILLPAFVAMYYVRKWRYEASVEGRVKSSSESSTASLAVSYTRSMRSRWVDVYVMYAFLVPAGISAGEHSSYWLVLAPVFMVYRFLFSKNRELNNEEPSSHENRTNFFLSKIIGKGLRKTSNILKRLHKYSKIVFASLAFVLLIISGSATLHQSLSALAGADVALRILLSPFAISVTFLAYFAPALLLPRYISRTFRSKVIIKSTIAAENVVLITQEDQEALEAKKLVEAKNKKWWLLIGFIAMGISAFTGSDLPIVFAFALQLFKANPDALITAIAEKGGMVEFETRIANAFERVVNKGNKDDNDRSKNNKDRTS